MNANDDFLIEPKNEGGNVDCPGGEKLALPHAGETAGLCVSDVLGAYLVYVGSQQPCIFLRTSKGAFYAPHSNENIAYLRGLGFELSPLNFSVEHAEDAEKFIEELNAEIEHPGDGFDPNLVEVETECLGLVKDANGKEWIVAVHNGELRYFEGIAENVEIFEKSPGYFVQIKKLERSGFNPG